MKLLVHSNAPWVPTGYGQQTRQLVERLRTDGHDPAVSCFYGLYGSIQLWDGIPLYPGGADMFGNDVLTAHALHHLQDPRAGWIITLMDVWTLIAPTLKEFNVASWVPVDHDPVPPAVVDFFRKHGATPIAMSTYGQTKLREAGLNPEYVPHGIDTNIFQPFDTSASRRMVAELGLVQDSHGAHVPIPDDMFVVGMNAANKGTTPPRKAFPQVFEAFRRFHQKHSDTVLYLHTEQLGTHQGMRLIDLAVSMGLGEHIFWTDQYAYRTGIIPAHLALIYSSMNVLANPSYGEGFGLPIIEAQACGVPVIVNSFTSMPELCGAGWQVTGEPYWNEGQAAWYQIPSVKSIHMAFNQAYKQADRLGDKARQFSLQYDADRVFTEHWRPLLTRLEDQIGLVDVAAVTPVDLAGVEL